MTKLDALAAAARQSRSPQTVQRQPQIQTPQAQLQSQNQESQRSLSTQAALVPVANRQVIELELKGLDPMVRMLFHAYHDACFLTDDGYCIPVNKLVLRHRATCPGKA